MATKIKLVLFLLLSVIHYVHYANGDCKLSLKTDFATPAPLFIQNGVLLAPDASGAISLKRSETIQIACPGDRKFIVLGNETTKMSELEAHCIINSTFRVNRWIGTFKDIKCNQPPWFTVENTKESCYHTHQLYRIGYKVGKKFYKVYEACFDPILLTTTYVKHMLSPNSIYFEPERRRPQFLEGDMFGKVRVSKLYSVKEQKARFNAVLGEQMSEEYISNNQYLARGHLAPRADFSLSAPQRASFHYINAAPQWQRGNSGDWAALEDAVRRRAKALGAQLTVYTGTYGVLSLGSSSGRDQPIYLSTDDNNNNIVPVPMYYYKVVYNAKERSATAFVSINSSFHNKTMIDNLQFCDDICDDNPRFAWLKWRPNDGTHSFCCDYEDFKQTVDHLPELDLVQSRKKRSHSSSFMVWLKSLFR